MDWKIFTKKPFLYTFIVVFVCLFILFQLIRSLSSVPILILVSAVVAYYYNNKESVDSSNYFTNSSNSDNNGSSIA